MMEDSFHVVDLLIYQGAANACAIKIVSMGEKVPPGFEPRSQESEP